MIAVLGPGGVGGLLAAMLDRAGEDVVVVAREGTAEELAASGIAVRSSALGEWTARPRVLARLDGPVDALLVATKATALGGALERVVPEAPDLVVPLLNGLEHVGVLRARFGGRAAVGTIRVDADRPRPGLVVHSSPGVRIDLAHDDPSRHPALEALAARLRAAGVTVGMDGTETQILWTKLARLCTIACTTTAFDRTVGELRSEPAGRRALERCVGEAVAAGVAEGADLDARVTMAELDSVHPGLGSSMRRDVAAGREPELDAIAGAVLRAGARHGLACPTISALAGRVAERAGVAPPAG